MSCGVGRRCGSDPAWLWLWCRPVATAQIRPLDWEPPYAESAALEKHTHTHTHTQKDRTVKVIKNKKSLRNCQSKEEPNETC